MDEAQLIADGYVIIDKGHFGTVFSKDNHVVKVYYNDPGYDAFLDFVKLHPSPYLPVIVEQNGHAVKMEKLSPIDSNLCYPICSYVYGAAYQTKKRYATRMLNQLYPGLTELLDLMYSFALRLNLNVDVHEGNVMLRGNIPVLIDPFLYRFYS